MAWFLFIDESGHDRAASPYEVLAGIAVEDRAVRTVIERLHEAEIRWFGRRYSDGRRELKGKRLLKRKVYRHHEFNTTACNRTKKGNGTPKRPKASMTDTGHSLS